MRDVEVVMVNTIEAHPPGGDREEACAAFYELWRARQRQERPTDPVGLLCVVSDALRTAARAGAITSQEHSDTLHEALRWAAEMLPAAPDGNGAQPADVPLLDSKGHDPPFDLGFPLEALYDAAGLTGADRVPSAVVLDQIQS